MSLRVVVSSPSLELSGANVLVANLLDQLHRTGLQTDWIVTGHNPTDDATWLGTRQFKIHRLPPTTLSNVRKRQELVRAFLEERAPCVYVPNFDFDMACVAPALSPANKVVLIMHCDDPVYYDFAARHGSLCNAIVCVSKVVANKLGAAQPTLRERIIHIPFGVEPLAELPARGRLRGEPLKVAYCGRLSFHQKRVQDLSQIINQCHTENQPVRFQIAGTGPDENAFFESIKEPLAANKVTRLGFLSNPDVLKLLSKAHAMVMTSDFEGLPIVLLEAMSRGCVPVVTQIDSGTSELIQHGVNGFLLPVGDIKRYVEVLERLSADPAMLRQLRRAAFDRIRVAEFTLERATADYRKLFESVTNAGHEWPAARNGKAIVPHQYNLRFRFRAKLKTLFNRRDALQTHL
jgi:glycosyltransferase involved in cell wall biosynthesis